MIENYTRLSSRMFTATVVGKDKNGRKSQKAGKRTKRQAEYMRSRTGPGSLKKQPKPTACSHCWNK